LRRGRRRPISTLARAGRFRSGQTGQTVNLLALRLRWFESSPAHFYFATLSYRRRLLERDLAREEERDFPRDDVDLPRAFAFPPRAARLRDLEAADFPADFLFVFVLAPRELFVRRDFVGDLDDRRLLEALVRLNTLPIAFRALGAIGRPLPANAPTAPPTAAPIGPAMLPINAPAAAPAAGLEMGGIWMFSDASPPWFVSASD
jgi:hypothetical protein